MQHTPPRGPNPQETTMKFELSSTLPIPVSVGERDGEVVLVLREGAVWWTPCSSRCSTTSPATPDDR